MKKYINSFKQYRFLLMELVKKGIKLKYRRSYLGIVWTLIEPLLTMIVLTVVFGTLFGRKDPQFPVYILAGRLVYTFFSEGTKNAMKSIRANAAMIKKVYVPKYLYPLSSCLYSFVIFLISLIILVVTMLIMKVYPTVYLLQAIVPLVILFIMTLGVGMILSTLAVFFRDLEYLWNVLLMLVMYASAIFYDPGKILKSNVGFLLKYNPLYCVIASFRNAVFGRPMSMKMIAYSGVISVMSLIVGIYLFYKNQDKYILHI